jgi:hypothetical protein
MTTENYYVDPVDRAKFESLSPEDQAFYSADGGTPDLDDPYIAARAPNGGIPAAELESNPNAFDLNAWPGPPPLGVDNGFTEPESPANTTKQPLYPYNNVTQTECGHSFEMDDTPTRERIRVQHGKSLTFFEMHPNGDHVHKVFGTDYEIVIQNKNVLIKGNLNVTINGDCNMNVLGDYNLQVQKDYNLQVGGRYNVRVKDEVSISGDKDVSISANENFIGQIFLNAADSLVLGADLVVKGSIHADVITAESRLATGTLGGVTAGSAGFVSVLGGLSLGIPAAVPGSVYAVGTGFFGISTFTPYSKSLWNSTSIGSAMWHFDVINFLLEKIHIHPAPRGATGPRTPPPLNA